MRKVPWTIIDGACTSTTQPQLVILDQYAFSHSSFISLPFLLSTFSFDSDVDHEKHIDYESKIYVTNIRDTSGWL